MPIPSPTTAPAAPSRVSRTLYRHLLKWCRATDASLPLTQWLPPIYLRAPEEVEPYHLEMLATTNNNNDPAVQLARKTLRQAQFHKHHLVVPVTHSGDLRNFFRVIFRINSYLPGEETYQKKRIDNAFQALKSLNQLSSETIAPFSQQRRVDRNGVYFSVGQVVRHGEQKWRGVILGWDKSAAPPSSLTTKNYSSEPTVTYHVVIDAGDAHQLNRNTKAVAVVSQHELELETNPMLKRIRHELLDEMFEGFYGDAFVPPPLLAYTYPNDTVPNLHRNQVLPLEITELANQMVTGVQAFAKELESIMEQHVGGPLEGLHLTALAAGHVAPTKVELSFVQQVIQESVNPVTMVALHMRDFIAFVDQLQDAFTHRQRQHPPIHFRVGDVIQHKVFGYRGVVTGWDDRPVVDVSRWDGIQALIQQGHDPNEMPFYHVVRHTEHHERGLGTPGAAMRYVCQENLEVCHNVADLDVDFEDPAWKREGDEFVPPPLLQFKYGQETDDSSIERCFTQMMQVINEWQSHAISDTIPPDWVARDLSVSNIMKCLRYCSKLSDASTLQEAIREIRQANQNIALRWKLAAGLDQTLSGKTQEALGIFKSLVEEDPSYVEAWNKRATCEFMLGLYDEATLSSKKVLELEPNHLPALNGLGLIHFQRTQFDLAAECFSRSIELDPWSPVAPKLSRCLDMMETSNDDSDD